jgi:hypothetical protein
MNAGCVDEKKVKSVAVELSTMKNAHGPNDSAQWGWHF